MHIVAYLFADAWTHVGRYGGEHFCIPTRNHIYVKTNYISKTHEFIQ